jgi:hypothetical protein
VRATESSLWRRIRPILQEDGGRAYRIETTTIPGFPDALWCPPFKPPVLIELKAGALRIGPWQKKLYIELNAIGTQVWIIWQVHTLENPVVWRGIDRVDWHDGIRGFEFDEWLHTQRKRTT